MVVTKLTNTTAKITFTGRANNHDNKPGLNEVDNVNNATITFQSAAFAGSPDISAIANKTKNDIAIEYVFEPPVFSYENVGSVFYEGDTDGQLLPDFFNYIRITVANGNFVGNHQFNLIKDTHFTVANVPNGLTMKVEKIISDDLHYLRIYFTGKATSHAAANDVNNVTITLLPTALTGSPNLSSSPTKTKNNISILFDKPVLNIRLSAFVKETNVNKGGIQGSITATIYNEKFVSNGALILNTHYTITGLPPGISFSRFSSGAGFIYLTVGALNAGLQTTGGHAASDSTTATITFLDAAFQGGIDASTLPGNGFSFPVTFYD